MYCGTTNFAGPEAPAPAAEVRGEDATLLADLRKKIEYYDHLAVQDGVCSRNMADTLVELFERCERALLARTTGGREEAPTSETAIRSGWRRELSPARDGGAPRDMTAEERAATADDGAVLDRLRRPVDDGGYDGRSLDPLHQAAAQRIEELRRWLGTEQTMHAAWRKRAEEAEALLGARPAEAKAAAGGEDEDTDLLDYLSDWCAVGMSGRDLLIRHATTNAGDHDVLEIRQDGTDGFEETLRQALRRMIREQPTPAAR